VIPASNGPALPIVASRHLEAPPEAVSGFLHRLENHARLAPRSVQTLYLHSGPDGRAHALVQVRGPFGIERTARADLLATPAKSTYVACTAAVGPRTAASVTWLIEADSPGSVVTLCVSVHSAAPLDGLLLRLGARRWLTRHLRAALDRLSEELAPASFRATGQRPRLALVDRAA
jgi:hypothetical protein